MDDFIMNIELIKINEFHDEKKSRRLSLLTQGWPLIWELETSSIDINTSTYTHMFLMKE